MSTTAFTVEPIDYEAGLADLRLVRESVFVREQGVPLALEWDELDPLCKHVIARDAGGDAIGTGRLTPRHTIGRMAVLPGWRGRGVGDAMLHALMDQARALGWQDLSLHAQASAIEFYARHGFLPVGDRFEEAGIDHQSMRRLLGAANPVETREAAIAAVVGVVATARRQVLVYTRELDPGLLTPEFIDAAAGAGVHRVSLGVQTLADEVQKKVNRIQPFDRVATVTQRLRWAGVPAINFDLMYGLPGQTPENVEASVRQALTLRPDRVAVFGYAHVPWMKKQQVMIREAELADAQGRWDQAEAADEALVAAGYVRVGLDHYALPGDPLVEALGQGRLRRNFQGYTDDPAPVMIPIGPSSIGRLGRGFVQNQVQTHHWGRAVEAGELPVARRLAVAAGDDLRAAVIERLMCDLAVDVAAVCTSHGVSPDALDACLEDLRPLQAEGLCRLDGRRVAIPEPARRLMRTVAACFDQRLSEGGRRHARAV